MDKGKLQAFKQDNQLKSLNHDHYNEVIGKLQAKIDSRDAEIKVLNDQVAQLEKFKAKKVKEIVHINNSKKKIKEDKNGKPDIVNDASRGHSYLMEGQYQFLKKLFVDVWGFEKYIEQTKELDAFAVEFKDRKLRLDAERSRQHLERNKKG